jgi:hypothetical protein
MNSALNRWYDSLEEPWRLLLGAGLILVGFLCIGYGDPPLKVGGALYLVALLLSRAAYIHGWL